MNLIKKFLIISIILIPTLVLANTYRQINYKITPLNDRPVSAIKVETEIIGDIDGEVILDLPYAWASASYYQQIKNVKLEYPIGKLKFRNQNSNEAIFNIGKINIIRLSYEIYQKTGNPSKVHEAIIRQNLIHSPGWGLFATPRDLKKEDIVEYNVEWNNIPEAWQAISDYGLGKNIKFKATPIGLYDAIYAAGDLRIYKIVNKKNPVYLSLHGQFDLKDQEIASYTNKIIKGQRAFFHDNDFPYYLISLVEGDQPMHMGGTALTHSFTAFIPQGLNKQDYTTLLAHEHLHNWIGKKIRNTSDLNYWWSEGFTDYYSRVLALRSGVITVEEFVEEFNQFFKDYYLSPVINEPNSKIEEDSWRNYAVSKLPYYRGFIFALYLNNLIKENSKSKSLDNVMLDLFKTAKQKEFSTDYFKQITKNYIPKGIDKEINEYIEQGNTIDLSDVAKILPIEKTKMGAYDRGFDRDALLNNNMIKNIDENSNAYKSGLQNGDVVINYDFPKWGAPDQIVTIKTARGEFKYRPESPNKKDIYRFKPDLSKEDKLKIKNFFNS
ncbi:M1 family aminopeptidase [Rickettsia endosymbiont of Lasioglossum villosulum]|uniref:M61 family metallopeptidase n=1 Tax=Rickettsia endosymbiont of Lasioglossum villosulum TaxID=3066269 RepID=UPI0031332659